MTIGSEGSYVGPVTRDSDEVLMLPVTRGNDDYSHVTIGSDEVLM